MRTIMALAFACIAAVAHAHSASDAYLSLRLAARGGDTVLEGQWDIALRDLHFVLGLDADGDGRLTWGEVRRREAAIAKYTFEALRADADGNACRIEPSQMRIAGRADGAYAALFFRIACKGAPAKVALDYRLFFAVDPSHRGIAVLRTARGASTVLFSPDNARVALTLDDPPRRIDRLLSTRVPP
jgi:hypothetical protein